MLKRGQAIIIALWIGTPFILLLVLLLINPAYESKLFDDFGAFNGFRFLLVLQAANAFILYRGFTMLNRATKTDGRQPRGVRNIFLLLRVLLLTLPALGVVLLYPAVILLLQESAR